VSAIQGSAGTGKTTMLSEARTLAEVHGYRMLGLAPSAAAAQELQKAGIDSQTIAAFKQRDGSLDARTILVLDEAGMVATRDMHRVLEQAEGAQARVVLVGGCAAAESDRGRQALRTTPSVRDRSCADG
jgi:ATP-dependent exoDNAse (exonuclease V) alpha subunit